MNNENLEFLRQSLRYLGFGESMAHSEQLQEEMQKGVKEFQLKTAACFDEWSTIQATLYFRRSENFDMYFFNKYDALLAYNDCDPKYNKMQTFYISKGRGVTFKEAFNLLQGRSVYKRVTDADGTEYNAWIQLSFSERTPNGTNYKTRLFGERYGYDLEKTLSTYPIRELEDEQLRQHLYQSLKKGNVQAVTFIKSSKIEKMYIQANPEYKTIIIYSELLRSGQRLPRENRVEPAGPTLFPDPESPAGKGEKEEEKNEEKEPPVKRRKRA